MLTKGTLPRVGDLARALAASPLPPGAADPASVLGTVAAPAAELVAGSPRPLLTLTYPKPLQLGYLDKLETCAAANECPWCQAALDEIPRPRSFTVLVHRGSWLAGLIPEATRAFAGEN
jgi:hypothetical protein